VILILGAFTIDFSKPTLTRNLNEHLILCIQGVSAKIFEPNISVICQRILMTFKMQIF
jgi:hypothetical protein